MGNPGFFLQQKILDLGLSGQEFTLLEKCGTKALQRAVKVKGRNSGLKKVVPKLSGRARKQKNRLQKLPGPVSRPGLIYD